MALQTVLVANRGEIAIRITRAAAELGLRTVAVHSDDDAESLHTAHGRPGVRARSVAAPPRTSTSSACSPSPPRPAPTPSTPATASSPRTTGSPGAAPRRASRSSGPSPEVLALFGDKAAARALGERLGVPVLRGTPGGITVDEAAAFMDSVGGPVILKATAGGGGRGSRIVTEVGDLPGLFERCRSEAASSFGDGTLFAEQLLVARPPRRGADRRRRRRRDQPPLGARVQPAAPAPEDRRDGAGAGAGRRRPRRPARRRRADGDRVSATAASARSSSSSTPTPVGTCSSRPTPACRSSTPSPRRSSASTSCAPSSSWPAAARWPSVGLTRPPCRRRGASPCSAG